MDDDYVAQVLANEARASSLKYSSQGSGAYLPTKPSNGAPNKPNTRFLRHLIKETDNHNVALKRKEEREARERMRQLKSQASGSDAIPKNDRQAGAREPEKPRREGHGGNYDKHRSRRERHRSRSASAERDRSRRHRKYAEYDRDERHRDRDHRRHRREGHRHEPPGADRRDKKDDRGRRHRGRSRSKSRSRSPHRDRDCYGSRRHYESGTSFRDRLRGHSHSRERHRGRRLKRDEEVSTQEHRSSRRETNARPEVKAHPVKALHHESADESDPLEDFIGPLPPSENGNALRSRGRGAYKPNSSTIDAHFAADYDPTLDVRPEEDGLQSASKSSSRRPVEGLMTLEDDWDMALEALRDRTQWRQKGEERMRAAGINDTAIDRWKNNAAFAGMDEGRPEDVQWSKKGEKREWDRGKVVDDDGHTRVRPAW